MNDIPLYSHMEADETNVIMYFMDAQGKTRDGEKWKRGKGEKRTE